MKLRTVVGASAILMALTACGDDPTTGIPAPEGTLPPRGLAEMTVLVSTAEGPLTDAGIVIETLDGTLIEQRTGRNGRVGLLVPVEDIRSLLAHKDGYSFAAISGPALDDAMQSQAGVQLVLDDLEPEPLATVKGFAWNMTSGDSWLTVSSTAPGSTRFQGQSNAFSLKVPANRGFQLIGLEWDPATDPPHGVDQTFLGWAAASSAGAEPGVYMTLDFAQSLPSEVVEGSFYIAPADAYEVTYNAYARVSTYESGGAAFLGAPTSLAIYNHKLNHIMAVEENTPPENWGKETSPPVVDFPYLLAQAEEAGVTPSPDLSGRAVSDHHMPVVLYPLGIEDTYGAFREGLVAKYTIEYLPLPRATLMTEYWRRTKYGEGGVVAKGAPVAGDSLIEVPTPVPYVSSPPPSLHEGVTWNDERADNAFAFVDVFDDAGRRVGTMTGDAREGQAHCPPLPSTSSDPVFEGKLRATLKTCEPSTELAGWCERYTVSEPFEVVP